MLPETGAPTVCDEPLEPAKKARHWDAWTQKEEEKFFSALRQVGKNFEDITSQVKSKNKDQVRHYYYRLIKRMNKFLNPDLSLDARNSNDVTTAMLCWWSLLEKHRCSYSKLHLKPRRLKTFVTSFEQLLRKKSKRKLDSTTAVTEDKSKPRPRKLNAKQKINALSTPTSSSLGDVSRLDQNAVEASKHVAPVDGLKQSAEPMVVKEPAPEIMPKQTAADCSPGSASTLSKYKLQLFPLDEPTKLALERDGHNPHLELTLKGTKSISSVIQHLWQKWGSSQAACGELRLFPYTGQGQDKSWGLTDAPLCAADVHAFLGGPATFQLKYGWGNFGKGEQNPSVPTNVKPEKQQTDEPRAMEAQTSGCAWLYEKSSDGFGQRLWRDEEQLQVTSNELSLSGLDWIHGLSVNVSQLLDNPSRDGGKSAEYRDEGLGTSETFASSSCIWGEETCDAFAFKRKEEISSIQPLKEPEPISVLLANNSQGPSNLDALRSSSLDLYWADSLGALDSFPTQTLLLNGNSSLGPGISASLFPDSSEDFPPKQT